MITSRLVVVLEHGDVAVDHGEENCQLAGGGVHGEEKPAVGRVQSGIIPPSKSSNDLQSRVCYKQVTDTVLPAPLTSF